MTKDRKKDIDLAAIKILVLDVDGVMTDGGLIIHADGSESKVFNILDGHGIRMWRRAGMKVAFLSGRSSAPTVHRAVQLEVDYVLEDCFNKVESLDKLLAQTSLSLVNVAYVGDDLMDLPVIRRVGFGAAVANAVDEVRKCADYVTSRPGGSGAVREVIEYILKDAGKWDQVVERYI